MRAAIAALFGERCAFAAERFIDALAEEKQPALKVLRPQPFLCVERRVDQKRIAAGPRIDAAANSVLSQKSPMTGRWCARSSCAMSVKR